jgi:hypothetical protein
MVKCSTYKIFEGCQLSVLYESLKGSSERRLILTQVALTFGFGGVNWASWQWWLMLNGSKLRDFPLSTDLTFWVSLVVLSLLPLVFTALSARFFSKLFITPLDICLITIGMFAVSQGYLLFSGFQVGFYYFTVFTYGFLIFFLGTYSNVALLTLYGIEGSEDSLEKRIYVSTLPHLQFERILSTPKTAKILGLIHRKDLNDGVILFAGRERVFRFFLAVSKYPSDENTVLLIVAYEAKALGMRKTDEVRLWLDGKIAGLLKVFPELLLTPESNPAFIRQSAIDAILEPTTGYIDLLKEDKWGYLRPLLIFGISAIALIFYFSAKAINLDTAVFISVTILLALLGLTVNARRTRRLR